MAAATGPGFQKFPLVHEGKQTAEVRLQIVSRRPDGLQVSKSSSLADADEEDAIMCDLAKVRVDRIFNVPEKDATYFVTTGSIQEKQTKTYETLQGKNKGVSDVLLREEVHDVMRTASFHQCCEYVLKI